MVLAEVPSASPGTISCFRNSVFWSSAFCPFQATAFAELSVLYSAAACLQCAVPTSSGELWLSSFTSLWDDYQEDYCRQQLLGACLPQASFSSPLSITGISVLISHFRWQFKNSRPDSIWDGNLGTICLPRQKPPEKIHPVHIRVTTEISITLLSLLLTWDYFQWYVDKFNEANRSSFLKWS